MVVVGNRWLPLVGLSTAQPGTHEEQSSRQRKASSDDWQAWGPTFHPDNLLDFRLWGAEEAWLGSLAFVFWE